MRSVEFTFLDQAEVASLIPDFGEVMRVVEEGLRAHGRKDVVLPPKSHILLDDRYNGHFNVLTGYVGPIDTAGVKVIGDYVDNIDHDLPSEVAMLTLYDPRTGVPRCVMDATSLTWLRTGAVTGIGARHLARRNSRILAHIGARGTAFANIKAIASAHPIDEVRITSKRKETREALARQVEEELGIDAVALADIADTVLDADIVVEATRLEKPQVLVRDEMMKPGSLLITYGWVMAVDPDLPLKADKLVVDDWRQCCEGGTFHPLIRDGKLTRDHLHAEIGEIVDGARPGRESDKERIVFWHRGFAVSDIVLGQHILEQADARRLGRRLKLW
ncbi:MAG: ornithine cyclodeaminase family protein [Parvibaculaceae bacterium]